MDASEEYTFAELLRQFRVREGMSQQELADQLKEYRPKMHRNTISAWERGEYLPETLEMVQKVAETLSLNVKDTQHLIRVARERSTSRFIWNIPHQRNPLFTGREAILTQLHTQLHKKQTIALTQPHAIHGLGGIGKTQAAAEYAHRHRNDYQAILWVQADTQDILINSYVSLATLLHLPERDEHEQQRIVDAVKRWLGEHTQWLLVLDNVEDMRMVKIFLPATYSGHVLVTTRSQALGGIAQGVLLELMNPDEGVLFLLRRATIMRLGETLDHVDAAAIAEATAIVEELGRLPLALDQAGAYLEETQCGLSHYLQLYQTRRTVLLQRRGRWAADHPESIVTTWSLSFEKVKQASPAAADLLQLCAFLSSDAIPEEIITKGASHVGPALALIAKDSVALDEAIAVLGAYSLLRRNARDNTLNIHRLVQAVLKDGMSDVERNNWVHRVTCAVEAAFPSGDFAAWQQCERYLVHALICAEEIEQEHLLLPEAASLLYRVGAYLKSRARYNEAESLLRHAFTICEQTFGPEHHNTAASLNNLAGLYHAQGKHEQAEPLYRQALCMLEQGLGSEHFNVVACLNCLATLSLDQGKYEQAESFVIRALTVCEQQVGPEYPDTARILNNLASSLGNLADLRFKQGKYKQVEPLFLRALSIYERQGEPEYPSTARIFNGLALLYSMQGKYEQAEPLFQRACSLHEKVYGPEHPASATSLNNLAELYRAQGRYEQAEQLLIRVLAIRERQLGPMHPDTAESLDNLASLYGMRGKYEQAEPLFRRALAIYKQQAGPEHPDTASSLNNLAGLYYDQGKYEQAESLYQQALHILEQTPGSDHPTTAASLNNLALLYRMQEKYEQAEPLYQRALAISERQLGPEHPDTASSLNNLAGLYRAQGKREQAEPLLMRALTICKQQSGPEHPGTINSLNNLAVLYFEQGKHERALEICESILGSHHPWTKAFRERCASLLRSVQGEIGTIQEELRSQDTPPPT